jgi:hypothetical protein
MLEWFRSIFTRPGYTGFSTTRLGYSDDIARERTLYMLAPHPVLPFNTSPTRVGYAATTGSIGVSYPNDSLNILNLSKPIQPSGVSGPFVNSLPDDELLILANIVQPGV